MQGCIMGTGQRTIIHHTGGSQFVVTFRDDTRSAPVTLEPPDGDLISDLRWYLEEFLEHPLEPDSQRASATFLALVSWGASVFSKLFGSSTRTNPVSSCTTSSSSVQIVTDDPAVLFWPWEALCEAQQPPLGVLCRFERRLGNSSGLQPLPLPKSLPRDKLNVLLITPRPFGDDDVGYHAVSRPLVEWVSEGNHPVDIDVLRPPLLMSLKERLRSQPAHYHIIHFDGHGTYDEETQESLLFFEDLKSEPDPVTAEGLASVLAEFGPPVVVLNACRSAHVDPSLEDPFASTAATLLKAGIRNVVAMSYNLYVGGAQQFVPAFYQRLVETGDVAEAARRGRVAMLENGGRACVHGEEHLHDWLIPVVYGHDCPLLDVSSLVPVRHRAAVLPDDLIRHRDEFIGREGAIQDLEHMLLSGPAVAVLIHGLIGVGKTTFIKGFLTWFLQTGFTFSRNQVDSTRGPFQELFWVDFRDIHSALDVIARLTAHLLPADKAALPFEKRMQELADVLLDKPVIMVWDYFERAAGIPGSGTEPQLDDKERDTLLYLLGFLRHSPSKVLIASRSPESWLPHDHAMRLPLRGLTQRESWEYRITVARRLKLEVDWGAPQVAATLDGLRGHPQAIREALPVLADVAIPPDEDLTPSDDISELLGGGLTDDFVPVLQCIGLHRQFVHVGFIINLVAMDRVAAQAVDTCDRCFKALTSAGLLHSVGNDVFEMYPHLADLLAQCQPASESQKRALVEFAAGFATHLESKGPERARKPLWFYGATFTHAMELAEKLGMHEGAAALRKFLDGVDESRSSEADDDLLE